MVILRGIADNLTIDTAGNSSIYDDRDFTSQITIMSIIILFI